MTDHETYLEYLKSRSALGLLYRRWVLYPRLCRELSGRALDVGCGVGDMLAFRRDTIGVDINSQAVEFCRSRGLDARPMEVDELPFPEAKFDSAILDNVLEHIAEPAPLLSEVRRVLKPGGTLVVGVPGELGFRSDSDHKVFYDERKLVMVLDSAGFECRTLFHIPWRSVALSRRVRQYCVYGAFLR